MLIPGRLRERLEKFTDFELEDVDNTGHCQFDAIAHQIAGRFADQYKVSSSFSPFLSFSLLPLPLAPLCFIFCASSFIPMELTDCSAGSAQ